MLFDKRIAIRYGDWLSRKKWPRINISRTKMPKKKHKTEYGTRSRGAPRTYAGGGGGGGGKIQHLSFYAKLDSVERKVPPSGVEPGGSWGEPVSLAVVEPLDHLSHEKVGIGTNIYTPRYPRCSGRVGRYQREGAGSGSGRVEWDKESAKKIQFTSVLVDW